jgi:putative endonuclease
LRGAEGDEAISMERQYCVYILTNQNNTVLYTGVTNNLPRRTYEHKSKLVDGFTKRYNINKLVYYEVFDRIENAILREKQIKGGSRAKKVALIKSLNPKWSDLSLEF